MRAAGFEKNIDPAVWLMDWIVDVEPVEDGRAVLKYLAPYVFRVAISDNRIVECTEAEVTYQYTPSGTTKVLTRTIEGWNSRIEAGRSGWPAAWHLRRNVIKAGFDANTAADR